MRIASLLLLLISLAATAPAEDVWRIRIHLGDEVYEHALAAVDSITFRADSALIEMALVPAGRFVMGDGSAACGVQEHEVTLTRDFHIARHETTNGEYLGLLQWAYDQGFVTATTAGVWDNLDGSQELLLPLDNDVVEIQFDGAGAFFLRVAPAPEAQQAYPGGYDPARHAVKHVTWFGAASFCDWLSLWTGLPRAYDHAAWTCHGGDPYGAPGYRLPTDAEWEYAAQYADERLYPWGDEPPDCSRANYFPPPSPPCIGWTAPAGSHPAAPAALGMSHLAGNMWELCNDWFTCDLGTVPLVDPVGPASGERRVSRAGGFGSVGPDLRCAFRAYIQPTGSTYAHGFRIARTSSR